jgi:hypothetical protein
MPELINCPKCDQPLTKVGKHWICLKYRQVFWEKSVAPMCIFLSYGYDANEQVVQHIKVDDAEFHAVGCEVDSYVFAQTYWARTRLWYPLSRHRGDHRRRLYNSDRSRFHSESVWAVPKII